VRKTFWCHVLGGHPHHHSLTYTGTCDGEGGCSHLPYSWLRTLHPVVSGTDQDVPNRKQSSLFQQRCLNAYLINDVGSCRTMKWALRACGCDSICAYVVLPYHSKFLHTHLGWSGFWREIRMSAQANTNQTATTSSMTCRRHGPISPKLEQHIVSCRHGATCRRHLQLSR
jgi:hypothetical protein